MAIVVPISSGSTFSQPNQGRDAADLEDYTEFWVPVLRLDGCGERAHPEALDYGLNTGGASRTAR